MPETLRGATEGEVAAGAVRLRQQWQHSTGVPSADGPDALEAIALVSGVLDEVLPRHAARVVDACVRALYGPDLSAEAQVRLAGRLRAVLEAERLAVQVAAQEFQEHANEALAVCGLEAQSAAVEFPEDRPAPDLAAVFRASRPSTAFDIMDRFDTVFG